MVNLDAVNNHRIFPVETRGDTLIIAPAGDLVSFSRQNFEAEFSHVKKILADPGIKNVIVDLGRSAYFGSEMIGAFIQLKREAGPSRQFAMCNVSEDMQAGFSIMNVDTLWMTFDTREQAVRALASEPVGQKVRRLGKPLLLAVAAVLLVGMAAVSISKYAGQPVLGRSITSDYKTLLEIYHDLPDGTARAVRLTAAEVPEGLEAEREAVQEIVNRLSRREGPLNEVESSVLSGARSLLTLIDYPDHAEAESRFLASMRHARRLLKRNDIIDEARPIR